MTTTLKNTETACLRSRMITPQDTAFIQRLSSSEDFLRYIGDKEIKDSLTPIGVCGLIKRDTLESHNIGFVPEVYGQVFALEVAQAIIE